MSGAGRDDTGHRCPRCDCPDGADQCDHCKVCPHARQPGQPMSAPCERPECGGKVHTDGWGTPVRCAHAPEPDDFIREECPHCDETPPRNRVDEHVATAHANLPPCTARIETEHRETYRCAFRAGHTKGEYGRWHASKLGADMVGSRYVWNDSATGATPHQPPEPSDSLGKLKRAGVLSHTVVATGGQHERPITATCAVLHTDEQGNPIPCPGYPHQEPGETDAEPEVADEGHAVPPAEGKLNSPLPVRPDPRQPAYDAVYEYIRGLGPYLPPDLVHRNAIIWKAVQGALYATPVGRCVSSHCVEGDHILDLGEAP